MRNSLLPAITAILVVLPALTNAQETPESLTAEGQALRNALIREASLPSKPQWQPMLRYLAELHGRSVYPPVAHLPFSFESIGPGYQSGAAFGHIDLTHQRLDTVRAAPGHVRNQIRNELAGQQEDGLIPGVIQFDKAGKAYWKDYKGFPPIWPVSVDAYVEVTSDTGFLGECLDALRKQIRWFEEKRAVAGGGLLRTSTPPRARGESGHGRGNSLR